MRVVLVIPVAVFTLRRTDASSWVAFFAFGTAALTDGFDGFLARNMGLVSKAGQLWDPIADKILVLVSIWALVVVGRFPPWAAWIIGVREVAVTLLRFAADHRGRGFPASRTGKLKTGAQLLAILFTILPEDTIPHGVELAALWSAVVLSVVSGAEYFARAPAILRRDDAR